ncbi:MAG: hypothetical protein KDE14_13460 [Rhodobacteraceae bacterium]|nr:hypothetical protein [Paracoccaceae bacterium]
MKRAPTLSLILMSIGLGLMTAHIIVALIGINEAQRICTTSFDDAELICKLADLNDWFPFVPVAGACTGWAFISLLRSQAEALTPNRTNIALVVWAAVTILASMALFLA